MDASTTLIAQSGANGGSAALMMMSIALALAVTVVAVLLAGHLKSRRTHAQTRRQLEQSVQDLQRCRDELDLAMQAAGDGHWTWDVRHEAPRLHGKLYLDFDLGNLSLPVDTVRWRALIHPQDLTQNDEALNDYLRSPVGTFISRFRIRDVSGRWRWIVSRGKASRTDAHGAVTHMIGIHFDETAQREAEIFAREEQAKLSGIFRTLPDGAGSSRISDGQYLEVNAAFERILGFSRDEVLGRTSLELGIWAIPSERETLVRECARHGKVDRLDMHARTKDGRLLPGQMSVSAATIGGEECFVFVFRDLSVEKKVESELSFNRAALDAAGRMARMGAWVIYFEGAGEDYWSPVCRDILGLAPEEPVPQNFAQRFVLPEYRQLVRDMEKRAREQHLGWDIEVEVWQKGNRPLWMRIVGEPVVEHGELKYIQGLMQDVDENHRAIDKLRQSEERFSGIFKYMPEALAIIDQSDGHYTDVNPAWEQMTGHERANVLGRNAVDIGLIPRSRGADMLMAWNQTSPVRDAEIEITHRTGEKRTTLVSMQPMNVNGMACWLSMHRDITERRRAQEKIQEREEQLSLSVAAANLGMWDMDLTTYKVSGNDRWFELRGLADTPGPVSLDTIKSTTHPDDIAGLLRTMREQYQTRDSTMDIIGRTVWPDGSTHWVRDLGKVVTRSADGQPLRMVGLSIDVTEQRLHQDRLQHLAHFDALTGLPNRILLADRMKQAMAQAERTGEMLGVVYLDLDGFKPVNDRLGHSAGDELLQQIAQRLPLALRAADSVARLGGDEFVLLLASLADSQDCILAMQRAMTAICEPCAVAGELVSVTASMGATLYPQDHSDADALLRHADQAMYLAKQAGRNQFHFFDAGGEEAERLRFARLAELRAAIQGQQFVLLVQPRVNMRTGKVEGAEALARWQHPTRGLLAPAHFLPDIESSDLETEFGEWVIESALNLLDQWSVKHAGLSLSINITARHLQSPHFPAKLQQQLAQHPAVEASRLEVEVTESGSLSDLTTAVNVIEQLHRLGVRVSLDDFGTGYSSLTYLRRLPVDTLKIDQSFIRDMLRNPDDCAIVKGVISLAQSFGRGVVAEGVETFEQGTMLLSMGCDMAQGYGIARPMAQADLPTWRQHWQKHSLWAAPKTCVDLGAA